jgi:hypothetical protein
LLAQMASAMFGALSSSPPGVQAPVNIAPAGSPLVSPAGFGPSVPGTPIPQGQIPGANLIPASPTPVLSLANRAPALLPVAPAANGVPDKLHGAIPAYEPRQGGALQGVAPDDAIAGLFIDEWSETLPDGEQTTGMAFHFDAPGARPPQAVLLAVPADPAADAWTLDALLATVTEAMALARLRAVRPQDLQGLGLILPGLFLSNNYRRDVPSVDFSKMLATSLDKLRAVAGIAGAGTAATMAEGKGIVSS